MIQICKSKRRSFSLQPPDDVFVLYDLFSEVIFRVAWLLYILNAGHTKKRPGQPETVRSSPEQLGNSPEQPGTARILEIKIKSVYLTITLVWKTYVGQSELMNFKKWDSQDVTPSTTSFTTRFPVTPITSSIVSGFPHSQLRIIEWISGLLWKNFEEFSNLENGLKWPCFWC